MKLGWGDIADDEMGTDEMAAKARNIGLSILGKASEIDVAEWPGLAAGNAGRAVQETADAVVSSNDDAGVAEALERFVLSGE